MTLKLRKALFPLHFVSKVFCIGPFSLGKLNPSRSGSIISFSQAVSYSIFHIWMSSSDMSDADGTKNMVRQLIDSYNRYSGFCVFCILVVASNLVQGKIVNVIQNIEKIDDIFQKQLNINMGYQRWRRNVSLQICVCFCAISLLEWRNCLMYIQDSIPFSHCLIMCLVPMYVIGITEIQFFAYLQLIRNRLTQLNNLLIEFAKLNNSKPASNVIQIQSFSFERFSSYERNQFKIPTINCIKYLNDREKKSHPTNRFEVKPLGFGQLNNSIDQIQHIFSMLERTVIILKSAYSPHLVVILMMKFTMLTSLLYFCCMLMIKLLSDSSLNDENIEQLLSSSAWIGAFFLEIFVLCFACTITTNETKKLGHHLHHVALRLESDCCKTKLKTFSMQLLFHGIEMNPFGLFHLDLNFMYGLVGAVCTYLIILVQFDLAQKAQQKYLSNHTDNHQL